MGTFVGIPPIFHLFIKFSLIFMNIKYKPFAYPTISYKDLYLSINLEQCLVL